MISIGDSLPFALDYVSSTEAKFQCAHIIYLMHHNLCNLQTLPSRMRNLEISFIMQHFAAPGCPLNARVLAKMRTYPHLNPLQPTDYHIMQGHSTRWEHTSRLFSHLIVSIYLADRNNFHPNPLVPQAESHSC